MTEIEMINADKEQSIEIKQQRAKVHIDISKDKINKNDQTTL